MKKNLLGIRIHRELEDQRTEPVDELSHLLIAIGRRSDLDVGAREAGRQKRTRRNLAPVEPVTVFGDRFGNDFFPKELWQTDFTYLKVLNWGWFYLGTILDDCSRCIISWKLCTTMKAEDVTATLDLALEASGCDGATGVARPGLPCDNGSSCSAGDLADYLDDKGMDHVRGAPCHQQTQGKIERWHQTMKNRVLLEHYFLP